MLSIQYDKVSGLAYSSIPSRKKERICPKKILPAVFVKKNGTLDVLYPNNDFSFIFFILGLDISDNFDCLGSKIVNFIQDMKPTVWSNSAK